MIIVDCWLLALDLSEDTDDFAVCSWSRATGYQTPNIIDCILRKSNRWRICGETLMGEQYAHVGYAPPSGRWSMDVS